ncbi:Retrotransposon Copia-like N-terminal domain-containing protein [Plasmodiophora brassicae]|uniref:Retrotransposon Copia-like N-terminal domain-containing protein n=1 Tax=Plasmodiophora brassicae TaxID=37360 RepID=A0A3P3Y1M5_PLABS|nr:unnamed protein product [Plasmodiophora brassicae]
MAAHVSKSFKGEKLKGADSYPTWAFAFKAFLRGRKASALITTKAETDQEDEVFAQLVAAVERSVMVHIMATETVHEAWAILQNQYASTPSTAHAVAIEKDLWGAEYKGNNSLQDYLLSMKKKLFKLKAAGGTIAKHLQVAVTVLLRVANPTVEAICSDLLLEDARLRRKKGGENGDGESALFTGDKTVSRKKSKRKVKETRNC